MFLLHECQTLQDANSLWILKGLPSTYSKGHNDHQSMRLQAAQSNQMPVVIPTVISELLSFTVHLGFTLPTSFLSCLPPLVILRI